MHAIHTRMPGMFIISVSDQISNRAVTLFTGQSAILD